MIFFLEIISVFNKDMLSKRITRIEMNIVVVAFRTPQKERKSYVDSCTVNSR